MSFKKKVTVSEPTTQHSNKIANMKKVLNSSEKDDTTKNKTKVKEFLKVLDIDIERYAPYENIQHSGLKGDDYQLNCCGGWVHFIKWKVFHKFYRSDVL